MERRQAMMMERVGTSGSALRHCSLRARVEVWPKLPPAAFISAFTRVSLRPRRPPLAACCDTARSAFSPCTDMQQGREHGSMHRLVESETTSDVDRACTRHRTSTDSFRRLTVRTLVLQ